MKTQYLTFYSDQVNHCIANLSARGAMFCINFYSIMYIVYNCCLKPVPQLFTMGYFRNNT